MELLRCKWYYQQLYFSGYDYIIGNGFYYNPNHDIFLDKYMEYPINPKFVSSSNNLTNSIIHTIYINSNGFGQLSISPTSVEIQIAPPNNSYIQLFRLHIKYPTTVNFNTSFGLINCRMQNNGFTIYLDGNI